MRSDSRWKIGQRDSLSYFSAHGLYWRKGDKTRMSSGIKHIRSHTLCGCWAYSWFLADLSGFDLKQAFMTILARDRAVRYSSSLPGLCLISPCGMKESECMLRLFPQINLMVPDWCLQSWATSSTPGKGLDPHFATWTRSARWHSLLKISTGTGQDLGTWLGRGVRWKCEK